MEYRIFVKKIRSLSWGLMPFIFILSFFWLSPCLAVGQLIKTHESPAVYYLDDNNIRHLFPTRNTYMSWYDDFSSVRSVALKEIVNYPLGKNITVRPGIKIVKFKTDPNYYGVEPGGVLRRFADNDIIDQIYGPDWQRRLVVIQDGFYHDYIISQETIKKRYQLPDGTVYQFKDDGQYYYINNNISRQFSDLDAVLANGFKRADIITSDVRVAKRKKIITGREDNIFNPVATPGLSTADCENKNFKVAFVLVSKDKATASQLSKLAILKNKLKNNFYWATRELAEVNVDYPIVVLSGSDDLINNDDGQEQVDTEAIRMFYDDHEDIFDFIILYNDFAVDEPVIANYVSVTNDFSGTGYPPRHLSYIYGSYGKLKGVANMGNLSKYKVDTNYQLDQSVNYIIHELGHHFSARAKFKQNDQISNNLLLAPNYDHWSPYLNEISPLGGSGWQDNGDGTYTNKLSLIKVAKKQYSFLDLYFMGLVPKVLVPPVEYLAPDTPGDIGNTVAGSLKKVTIDQITKVMGKWHCTL